MGENDKKISELFVAHFGTGVKVASDPTGYIYGRIKAIEKQVEEFESFKSAIIRADDLVNNIKWDEPDTRSEYDKIVEGLGFQKALDAVKELDITNGTTGTMLIRYKDFNKLING